MAELELFKILSKQRHVATTPAAAEHEAQLHMERLKQSLKINQTADGRCGCGLCLAEAWGKPGL
jgi:hypothetical protein